MNTKNITKQGITFLAIFIMSICVSIIATIVTEHYLEDYADTLDSKSFDIFSAVKPILLPGTYEEALTKVRMSSENSIALLVAQSNDTDELASWKTVQDVLAYGVVVTRDGWVLFDSSSLPGENILLSRYDIWVSGVRYSIDDAVFDVLTNAVLIHIEGENMQAFDFGLSKTAKAGEMIFVVNGSGIAATSIFDPEYLKSIRVTQAEVFNSFWKLSSEYEAGLPVLNSNGAFIAFTLENAQAIPIHYISSFITSVLESSKAQRAGLGAYVVDVDSMLNLSAESINAKHGALIVAPNVYTKAVINASPAAEAGLKEGDVILAVNGVNIELQMTLAELLAEYLPDDSIVLRVQTQDGQKDMNVILTQYQDLIY